MYRGRALDVAINKFQNQPEKVWAMDSVIQWLVIYENLYQECSDSLQNIVTLPEKISHYDDNIKFLNLYEELKELQSFYLKEECLKKRIKDLKNNQHLINFYRPTFIDEYTSFIIDYLDNDFPLSYITVNLYSFEDLEVLVLPMDFKNTIEYIEIMNV